MSDSTNITLSAKLELDKKSLANAEKQLQNIGKESVRLKGLNTVLREMGHDWGLIAKRASSATTEIEAISDAAEVFAHKLGTAAMDSVGKLKGLGNKLKDAQDEAQRLSTAWGKAGSDAERDDIKTESSKLASHIKDLTRQVNSHRAATVKDIQAVQKLAKAQDKYQKRVSEAAKFDTGDLFDGLKDKIASGNLKGLFGELGGGIKKSLLGGIARGGEAKAAAAGGAGTPGGQLEMANTAKALQGAAMGIGLAVAGFAAFVMLVKAASDHMTGLNKALISGMGFANDFVDSSKGYRDVIDEMRGVAIDSAGAMLKYGKNSEDVLKIINSYAKESTGSLIQTRETMKSLGGKDVAAGINQFAQNSILYGKALNMEAEEVASMMGKFQSEVGYGANQIQDVMNSVVSSARTAAMPMGKFMDIFKQVIPNVELYQNRVEELTGTMKLLSKAMSPKDVKQFMDAFSKGFSGTDFKQRLKTVLMVGTEKVNGILEKGFGRKAEGMAKTFEKYSISKEEFMVAFKGGEKGMAALMAKAQAKSDGEVGGAQVGEAMKLASFEAARQKGGPLNTATALRGASMLDTYKILKDQSQKFTQGFDGLSEAVIQNTGINEQSYIALRQTHQSMEYFGAQIKATGITSSKSMNAFIKSRTQEKKWAQMSQEEQEDLLFEASQQHEEDMGAAKTMDDLAQEQVSATTSISDKITNVIAFLLEKLFNVMQPLLDILDDLWRWLTGTDDQKKMIKEMQNWRDSDVSAYQKTSEGLAKAASDKTKSPEERKALKEQSAFYAAKAEDAKIFAENVGKALQSGQSATQVAKTALNPRTLVDHMSEVVATVKGQMSELDKINLPFDDAQMLSRIEKESATAKAAGGQGAYSEKELEFMITQLTNKNAMANIMTFGKMQVAEGAPSAAGAARADYKGATQRPGWELKEGPKDKKEAEDLRLAQHARDYDPEYKARFGAGGANGAPTTAASAAASASKPAGTGAGAKKRAAVSDEERQRRISGLPATSSGGAVGVPEPIDLGNIDDWEKTTEKTNTQVESTNDHLGKIHKDLDEVKLDKSFVRGPYKKSVEEAVLDGANKALFKYFLYSGDERKVAASLQDAMNAGAQSMDDVAGVTEKYWTGKYEGGPSVMADVMKDIKKREVERQKELMAASAAPADVAQPPGLALGGPVLKTGKALVHEGEFVIPKGGMGGSVAINATINVSGAGDPKAVAIEVQKILYEMSTRNA